MSYQIIVKEAFKGAPRARITTNFVVSTICDTLDEVASWILNDRRSFKQDRNFIGERNIIDDNKVSIKVLCGRGLRNGRILRTYEITKVKVPSFDIIDSLI